MSAMAEDVVNDALSAERAVCYRLLATLLRRAPDDDLLRVLASMNVDGEQEGSESWHALAMSARMTDVTTVAQEYQDLFIGIGRGELVPYASWYQTGFLMEKPLMVLRNDLHKMGFVRDESVKEPEDHIAALCEVMAFLIEEGDDSPRQKAFFRTHLSPWAEQFFTDLSQTGNAVFYRSVGYVGDAYMKLEEEFFGP